MRKMHLAIAVVLLSVPYVAGGQQTYGPTGEASLGLFSVSSAQTLPAGTLSVSLYVNNFDREAATMPRQGPNNEWEYDFSRLSVATAVGVTEKLQLNIIIPIESVSDESDRRSGYIGRQFRHGPVNDTGVGAPRLGAKWRLASDAAFRRGIAAETFVDIPVIENEFASRTLGYEFRLDAMSEPWVLNLAYAKRSHGQTLHNAAHIAASLGFGRSISEHLDVITEVEIAYVLVGDEPRPPLPIDLTAGIRRWFGSGRWSVSAAVRVNTAAIRNVGFRDPCPLGFVVGIGLTPTFFDTN